LLCSHGRGRFALDNLFERKKVEDAEEPEVEAAGHAVSQTAAQPAQS
jgi:hypothetical protein